MPAPLEMFLRAITSGNTTFTKEMYDHFGGDDVLEQLRKYDPDAKWTDIVGNDEGQVTGKRLDFDVSKLPQSKKGTAGLDLRAANFGDPLKGSTSYEDDVYGDVRNSAEFRKPKDPLWTMLAPIAVSTLAPMAGAALAGAGIGLGAGGTSALTGGLVGAAPFAPGAGTAAAWTKLLPKLPQFGRQLSSGKVDWMSLLGAAGGAAGVPGASQLSMLMRLLGR